MGSERHRKTGHYLIGSAVLWGLGTWAVEWFVHYEESLFRAIAAAAGGLLAGWFTALVLGRLAKWGFGFKTMMAAGLLFGVAFASGAVSGLNFALSGFRRDAVRFDWESFQAFVLSVAVVPAAALGIVTGLYVRLQVPRTGKKA